MQKNTLFKDEEPEIEKLIPPEDVTGKIMEYRDLATVIDVELEKRRGWWRLEAPGLSYDDIKQEIRIHISKKWEKWDQKRPFANWVNGLISNQLKNKLRDNFGIYVRPCLFVPGTSGSCEANEGGDRCRLTKSGLQCAECPMYAKWEREKKEGLAVHLPESLDDKEYHIGYEDNDIDAFEFLKRVAPVIKEKCLPQTYKAFELIYIKNMSEKEAAKLMGYKSTEKGRKAGYKQMANHTEQIKKIIIELLKNEEARFV